MTRAKMAEQVSPDPTSTYLKMTAVEHTALMKGALALMQDVTELLFRVTKEDRASDVVNAGDVEDCVVKLDTLGNLMTASNDDMLDVLRRMGEPVPLSSGALIIRKGV